MYFLRHTLKVNSVSSEAAVKCPHHSALQQRQLGLIVGLIVG